MFKYIRLMSVREKLIRYIITSLCKHRNKLEIYRDYPDRYIKFKCEDCGEEVYEDL